MAASEDGVGKRAQACGSRPSPQLKNQYGLQPIKIWHVGNVQLFCCLARERQHKYEDRVLGVEGPLQDWL